MGLTASRTDAAANGRFPAKGEFARMDMAYLDSGTVHPIPLAAKAAAEAYLSDRTYAASGRGYHAGPVEERVRQRFATLINAAPDEICLIPNTTSGENLVLAALGLPQSGAGIVTDTLHFAGSYYLYRQLEGRGADVTWLQPRDGRIDLNEVEAAVTSGTRLIAISLVSALNGFHHDLEALCRIAHARGAYVYADIAHAAGSVPVDVRASGVDFAACPSFKWLMGDFGLGFLYVRSDLLKRIQQTQFGYYQLASFRTPAFPFTPGAGSSDDYAPTDNASGFFALGTLAHATLAQVDRSLALLLELGVDNIQRFRQPMADRLKSELPQLGFKLMTPPESASPLITCACPDPRALTLRLDQVSVRIAVAQDRFRVSLAAFNDMDDVERLLEALRQ